MRLARVEIESRETVAVCRTDQRWYEILSMPGSANVSDCQIKQIISQPELLHQAKQGQLPLDLESTRFLCPLTSPGKIICIGKNYSDHAVEMGSSVPDTPVVFSKFNTALIGPGEPITLPSISRCVDFEAELVAVIGKTCRFVAASDALSCVFGYTIGNDVTARDWQKGRPGGQWLLGKSFDTFAPLGPYVVTADEVKNPADLVIELKLNDQTMQIGSTSQMIFSIEKLIAHLSMFVTLHPGDLLFTGTPAGVGAGRTPPVFLRHGDEVEIEISRIGKLKNPVRSANSLLAS